MSSSCPVFALTLPQLVPASLCGCHSESAAPKYANWEPLTAAVPAVDAKTALQRLEQSRQYWELATAHEHGSHSVGAEAETKPQPQYSYVRAKQLNPHRVEFTIIAVEGGRVVARGQAEIDPRALLPGGPRLGQAFKSTPRELWRELDKEIGRHEGGAPPRLISELYDECAAEIRRDMASPIRLYFHPSGILMQCGRPEADCADCARVSIQSYALNTISPWARQYPVSHWACTEPWGLILPGAINWLRGGPLHTCAPPSSLAAVAAVAHRQGYADPLEPTQWPQYASEPTLECSAIAPSRPPGYLDVGKADPDQGFQVWANLVGWCNGARDSEFRMQVGYSLERLQRFQAQPKWWRQP